MAGQTICPRCGARDSFKKGYLPETCVCRVCLSQLDWREIPGCGPDCQALAAEDSAGQADLGETGFSTSAAESAPGATAGPAEPGLPETAAKDRAKDRL